jgi:hypothetical protein
VQDRVIIRNAGITWQDDLRKAPPLELKRLNFQLDNRGSRHRFGLTADPPRQLAARIDIRGDFKGLDLDQLDAWKGEVYAELDYADLAGWRTWVDYPVALPQGSGALRLWLGFANKQLISTTADVRLADVRLQLRPDLPELDLLQLEGRLAGRRLDSGFEAELKQLTLATRDGLSLQPTDLKLVWQNQAANRPPQRTATATGRCRARPTGPPCATRPRLRPEAGLDRCPRKRRDNHEMERQEPLRGPRAHSPGAGTRDFGNQWKHRGQ